MSNWIMTQSGGVLDYDAAEYTALSIDEIAHSLSNQCRYNGHCSDYYSVAEHSVHVSHLVGATYNKRWALAALLHDASEAYVCDLPRPLKKAMGKSFSDYEDKAMLSVAKKFGLEVGDFHHQIIKDADNVMIYYETSVLMNYHPVWETFSDFKFDDNKPNIECLNPRDAKSAFLQRYEEIMAWPT